MQVRDKIEDLIVNHYVSTFLFGSKSEFDTLCHSIVADLKCKYPFIKRVAYTCCGEGCVLESEKKHREEIFYQLHNQKINLLSVDEEYEHKSKYTSGKASYVERNRAMINDSDYCLFYFDKTYQPSKRKHSKREISYYQPKSGTYLAYLYAIQKKKKIINFA